MSYSYVYYKNPNKNENALEPCILLDYECDKDGKISIFKIKSLITNIIRKVEKHEIEELSETDKPYLFKFLYKNYYKRKSFFTKKQETAIEDFRNNMNIWFPALIQKYMEDKHGSEHNLLNMQLTYQNECIIEAINNMHYLNLKMLLEIIAAAKTSLSKIDVLIFEERLQTYINDLDISIIPADKLMYLDNSVRLAKSRLKMEFNSEETCNRIIRLLKNFKEDIKQVIKEKLALEDIKGGVTDGGE